MSTKPKLYLLDANVLLQLHRLQIWNEVLQRAIVVLGSIVADQESRFWQADDRTMWGIDLQPDLQAGRLKILGAEAADLAAVAQVFDPTMAESIHAGELEAITLLRVWDAAEDPPPLFCTGDRKAVEATCLLGLGHLTVSLEEVLHQLGVPCPPGLKSWFRKLTMEAWVREGKLARIQGRGLR